MAISMSMTALKIQVLMRNYYVYWIRAIIAIAFSGAVTAYVVLIAYLIPPGVIVWNFITLLKNIYSPLTVMCYIVYRTYTTACYFSHQQYRDIPAPIYTEYLGATDTGTDIVPYSDPESNTCSGIGSIRDRYNEVVSSATILYGTYYDTYLRLRERAPPKVARM